MLDRQPGVIEPRLHHEGEGNRRSDGRLLANADQIGDFRGRVGDRMHRHLLNQGGFDGDIDVFGRHLEVIDAGFVASADDVVGFDREDGQGLFVVGEGDVHHFTFLRGFIDGRGHAFLGCDGYVVDDGGGIGGFLRR